MDINEGLPAPLYEIMDGINRMVQAGKARYIGISNCFAWQFAKAHALVGVMAQNTASAAKESHVWSTGNQEIK